jgi:hypothetical protein
VRGGMPDDVETLGDEPRGEQGTRETTQQHGSSSYRAPPAAEGASADSPPSPICSRAT